MKPHKSSKIIAPELALTTRSGLPDAMRVLVRELPRAQWDDHPNLGELVKFWLDRHLMFRRLLEALETDIQGFRDGKMGFNTYAPRLGKYGGMLLDQLHGHHQIEDHHYFPALIALDVKIEGAFDLLENDHGAMDGLLHGFATVANQVISGGESGDFSGAMHDNLQGFRGLLDRHLNDEEEIIVPLILKTGFTG